MTSRKGKGNRRRGNRKRTTQSVGGSNVSPQKWFWWILVFLAVVFGSLMVAGMIEG